MSFNILVKEQLERLMNKLLPQIYTYGICSTANSELVKTVVMNGFILKPGARISVRFTDTSATAPSSGSFTLNVNNTGAKPIKLSDDVICSYEYANSFINNNFQQFVYDGTNWVWTKENDSSSGGSSSDVLVATVTGNDSSTISNLLSQLFPYLENLSNNELRNSYIVYYSTSDSVYYTMRFSCKDFEKYSYSGTDVSSSSLFSSMSLSISEDSAVWRVVEIDTDDIVGGVIRETWTASRYESFSLYKRSSASGGGGSIPDSDALITVAEFENLT